MIYQGGCHCGAVRFEVEAPETVECQQCNCSICTKSGFLHLIVPKSRFRLLQGEDQLTSYSFGTGAAKHLFCRICGIKSFYVPRSNPDGIDVNVHCLDRQPEHMTIEAFDGKNWERHGHKLSALSKDA
ncbi:MAG: GFA family protein [Gammaproteobacteria bacterium]